MNIPPKLHRRISIRIALSLFLLFYFMMPALCAQAQVTSEEVSISSHFEEDLTILGDCPDHSPGTYRVDGWVIYLAWDMTPEVPFYDINSPDGFWGTLGATSILYPGWALPLNHHSREALAWMSGCFNIEQTRQDYRDDNWYVSAEFHYPDGSVERIFSNITDFDGQQELIPKEKLVPIERMSLTKDPINIATGEMIIQATDFSFDGRGPALKLARTYRSQSNTSGLFGYGWHSAYDANLTEDIVGNIRIFNEQGGGLYFNKNEDGTYVASPGSYASLVKNVDDTYTVTNKHGIATQYGSDGRLSAITDRNGNTLRLAFDPLTPDGTYIEDAGGRKIVLTVDSQQRIIAARGPSGKIVQYVYDELGNLVTITNPEGNSTTYTYDSAHNITEMTNVNGHKTYFSYDSSDRAVMNWQEDDVNKVTLVYPGSGGTYVTNALGNRTDYYYNQFGLTTRTVNSLGNTQRTGWDRDMNRTSVTDARGSSTTFEYDSHGNLVGIVDPLGAQKSFTYTGDFNLVNSETDALGNTSTYTYDVNGNPSTVTDALGNQTQMAYDVSGNLISTTDALNNAVSFQYDSFGQMTRITDALSNETTLTYDTAGNNITRTDATGNTTQFAYDVLNRLTSVHFADGTSETYTYDAFGNRTGITDQKGRTTTNVFDQYERLTQMADPLGNATQYTYDKEGNVTALTDANSGTTTYTYDPLGYLISEASPIGKTTLNAYDENGNVISRTDPNDNTIIYTYDALNRLTAKEYPDKTIVSFVFDVLGRRISMSDGQGVSTYSYDALDRLLAVDGPQADRTIQYTYDALGNRITMVDQDSKMISYTYDELGRQVGVADGFGVTQHTYDELSNITAINYPSGASVNYAYDIMNRPLTVINAGTKNTTISSLTYIYDAAGMITQKENEDGVTTQYQYDALDRLIREINQAVDRKGNARIVYDYQYIYDAIGNRLSFVKSTTLNIFWKEDTDDMPQKVLDELKASGYRASKGRKNVDKPLALTKIYIYDADNRLLSYSQTIDIDSIQFPVETVIYAYDESGNRQQKQQVRAGESNPAMTHYSYDYENRLTNLEYINQTNTENISNAAFKYNADGLRTKAVEGDKITQFYYDGRNIVLETDGLGETQRSYVRALGFPGGIGGLIAQKSLQEELVGKGKNRQIVLIEKNHYYHYDALGSVVNLSDEGGYHVSDFEYDAFGNVRSASDTVDNDYLFSSKEFEAHAGLYFFGARYYDPLAGRWLTPDPLGFIDGPNVYAYASNNPVNLVDLFGLDAIVLNKPRGAGLLGHQAVAIGNDQTGWDYYSRSGKKAPNAHERYDSIEEMMAVHGDSYYNRYRIKTTSEQDWQMVQYADKHISDRYGFFTNNCSDLVSETLQKGGIKTGSRPIGNWPNIAYQSIIKANKKE